MRFEAEESGSVFVFNGANPSAWGRWRHSARNGSAGVGLGSSVPTTLAQQDRPRPPLRTPRPTISASGSTRHPLSDPSPPGWRGRPSSGVFQEEQDLLTSLQQAHEATHRRDAPSHDVRGQGAPAGRRKSAPGPGGRERARPTRRGGMRSAPTAHRRGLRDPLTLRSVDLRPRPADLLGELQRNELAALATSLDGQTPRLADSPYTKAVDYSATNIYGRQQPGP
jgi:hypothetical protein